MKKILNTSAGSALTMALIGVVALGGLALVVMNQSKNYGNINSKLVADKDVDVALLKISSMLLVPKNCNANFYGLNSTSGTLPDIRSCNSGACLTAGMTNKTLELTVMDAAKVAATSADNQWSAAPAYTGLTTKVRVTSLSYTMETDQATGPSTSAPAIMKLTIVFEKNLGLRSGGAGTTKIQTSKVTRELFVPVIRKHPTPYSYPTSPTILGCPTSPSATAIQST